MASAGSGCTSAKARRSVHEISCNRLARHRARASLIKAGLLGHKDRHPFRPWVVIPLPRAAAAGWRRDGPERDSDRPLRRPAPGGGLGRVVPIHIAGLWSIWLNYRVSFLIDLHLYTCTCVCLHLDPAVPCMAKCISPTHIYVCIKARPFYTTLFTSHTLHLRRSTWHRLL